MKSKKVSSYRLLVCGSRYYTNRKKIYKVLDFMLKQIGDELMIISGGARGADTIAREWAVDRQVDHVVMYAKWKRQKRSAGPIRNRRMAKLKPHLVFAFHPNLDESKGTRDMINIARSRNIHRKVFT